MDPVAVCCAVCGAAATAAEPPCPDSFCPNVTPPIAAGAATAAPEAGVVVEAVAAGGLLAVEPVNGVEVPGAAARPGALDTAAGMLGVAAVEVGVAKTGVAAAEAMGKLEMGLATPRGLLTRPGCG